MYGRVCTKENTVLNIDLKSRKIPYICIMNPTVVNMNHPTQIIMKPAKKNADPRIFDFFAKKATVFCGPIKAMIPIMNDIWNTIIKLLVETTCGI